MIPHLYIRMYSNVGRHSVVSIVTRYGLNGQGIESGRGREFLYRNRPALGPILSPLRWVSCLLASPKGAGAYR